MTDKTPPTEPEAPEKADGAPDVQRLAYFLIAVLVFYRNAEGTQKKRHLNLVMSTNSDALTKQELARIQHGAAARIHAENGIAQDAILDVVTLAIMPLGFMTEEEFQGADPVIPAAH